MNDEDAHLVSIFAYGADHWESKEPTDISRPVKKLRESYERQLSRVATLGNEKAQLQYDLDKVQAVLDSLIKVESTDSKDRSKIAEVKVRVCMADLSMAPNKDAIIKYIASKIWGDLHRFEATGRVG